MRALPKGPRKDGRLVLCATIKVTAATTLSTRTRRKKGALGARVVALPQTNTVHEVQNMLSGQVVLLP